jgi:beta-N-acetylhexosaminidase
MPAPRAAHRYRAFMPLRLRVLALALAAAAPRLAAQPVAPPGAARDGAVEARLARMSTRDKAAQLVMPWIPGALEPGTAPWRRAVRWAAEARVGGFIVGKGERGGTVRALAALQREAGPLPLLMASDLEWGAGMRLLGATLLPPAMAVAATGDSALAYAHGLATAREGRAAGLHVALAPSLDVNVNPANPIINTRSFGGNASLVGRFGTAAMRGLQDGGLLAVGKHFPGHGDTDQDSHLTLPSVDASRARLDSVELPPFRQAVRAGMGGVLVGHIAAPALSGDRTPASLSPAVATTLLRRDFGFAGLVFTDALNMAGVARRGTTGEVAVAAVRAGADVLLQPPEPERAIEAIVRAVARGEITGARLDASVRRVLSAKARLGLLGPAAPARAASAPDAPAGLAATIAARSMTLLRDSAALLPLGAARPVLSLVYEGDGAPRARASPSRPRSARRGSRYAGAWSRSAPRSPSPTRSRARAAPRRSWCSPPTRRHCPWQGSIGLPPRVAAAFERLARRTPLVHAAFGDPYVVGGVPSATAVLLGWSGAGFAQRAAAAALLGAAPVAGRLPVAIPPRYPIGSGITRAATVSAGAMAP